MQEDLMSLDFYSVQDLLSTLLTKNAAHTLNPMFMVESLDKFGYYVKTDTDKCRIIVGNEFDYLLFRGQNRNYRTFSPSFKRINKTMEPIKHCVEWIKKEEFKELFTRTPYFERLPKEIGCMGLDFDFDLEALAQHYEFKTNYLDITKNFAVALFFAYTDCINGRYYPIQDFKQYNPHIYVASIGTLQQFYRDNFKVVGFQVSQRPYAQQAMALDIENLAKVKNMFAKIKLPQNEYFSVGIYNSFKKGYSLFVPDQLGVYANRIKTENVLYENLIEQYFKIFKIKNSIIEDLIKNGYKITKDKFDITKQEAESMHIEINNIIKPLIAEKIGYRKISFPK